MRVPFVRRVAVALVAAVAGLAPAGQAQAVMADLATVSPTPTVLFPGASIFIEVGFSGLGLGTDPSITALDLDLSFDPSKISFVSGSFFAVPGFGDNSCPPVPFDPLCESLVDISSTSGTVTVGASSLLAPAVIDANQQDVVTFALLEFLALMPGSSSLSFTGLDVSGTGPGGDGPLVVTSSAPIDFDVVPEPGTATLLALGLSLLALRRTSF